MVFVIIKSPQHQDAPDSCTPTCIKVILDQQFGVSRRLSFIKKWVGYEPGCGSCSPYNTPVRLEEPLAKLKLIPHTLTGANNTDFIDLLNKKQFPFLFLKLEYLNETGVKKIKVYDGGEDWWHCVVICGFDEKNENVFIYDPYLNYDGPLNESSCHIKIPYALLTKYWKATNNRLFWIASIKAATQKEKDKQLTEY